MKEDKKEMQPTPIKTGAETATPDSTVNDTQQTAPPTDEQNNEDYVVVGSGLGIDE